MRLMLEAPVGGMLAKLSAPNIAATLMSTVSTFADVWYVGQLGTQALASLALAFPFLMLMNMMSAGAIGGGVTSAVSRMLGRGDHRNAQLIAWHSILIALGMAAIFTLALGVFPRPIYALMGGLGAVLDGAVLYSSIAFGGALAVWLLWVLAAMIRGTGDMTTPARAVLISGVAQIGLAGILTLGLGPIPSFGIAGPAIAMIVCQGLAAAYLFAHVMRANSILFVRPGRVHWDPIAQVMRVGGLGLVNSSAIALTVAVVTGFVGRYGTEALAGYGLGSRLELMLIPVAFGIGGAMTVAVGANYGAGNYPRARKIAWAGASAVFLSMSAIGLAVALFPGLWLSLFTADPLAYEFGARYLSIVGPVYGFLGGGQALYFACQGTGHMMLPVLVGVIRLMLVTGVGFLAVYFSWQVSMIFGGVAIGLIVIGVGLALCMRSRAWFPQHEAATTGAG